MADEDKSEVKKLMGIEGEVRGIVFKTDGNYILKEKGKEALSQLEAELGKRGCPIKYEAIKTMGFYPVGLRPVSLLTIKDIFEFSDEKIREMGFDAPKVSLIIKLFVKYFVSIPKAAQQVSAMWKEHYTKGELKVVEVSEEEKRLVLRLENMNLHPVVCQYLLGYFASITQMVTGAVVIAKETKCFFLGDEYHEYLLTW